MDISAIKHRILAGGEITADEALALADPTPEVRKAMREVAAEITAAMGPRKFDSCSIINARSGRCPEDCKWCAQSAHYPPPYTPIPWLTATHAWRWPTITAVPA